MKIFKIVAKHNVNGDPVFREIKVCPSDQKRLLTWNLNHSLGRKHSLDTFGDVHFQFFGFKGQEDSDFAPSGYPGGIWSARSSDALSKCFLASGDLHSIVVDGHRDRYRYFDCWTRIEARPNNDYIFFDDESLKTVNFLKDQSIPDIFRSSSDRSLGLLCSETFKSAFESNGFTGIDFIPAEVIRI